jgi:hypothetical protein
VLSFLVPADHKLIAKARKRGGEAAARAMIERIARRAAATTVRTNARIGAETQADPDDIAWPPALGGVIFTNFGQVRVESGFKTHIAVANLFCQTFPSGESSS